MTEENNFFLETEPKEENSITKETPPSPMEKTKALRAHKKIDYYEEFSDGDQEDYEEVEEKRINNYRNPPKRNKRRRSFQNDIEFSTNNADYGKEANKSSNYGHIIDLQSLYSKDNKKLENSELILIILEICLNSAKYGIDCDNSSRYFWEKLSQREDLFKHLSLFKPETLRKYWRKLRTTYKYKKLISSIKEYSELLNDDKMKLLSSINAISDYVINPSRGIDYYIKKYSIKQSAHIKKENSFNEDEEENYKSNETENEEEDKPSEKSLNEIIEALHDCFPEINKKLILQKIIEVNGNIENAYLCLKDPEHFRHLEFNEEEDQIILNDQDEDEKYKELIHRKGFDNIRTRKDFLLRNQEPKII